MPFADALSPTHIGGAEAFADFAERASVTPAIGKRGGAGDSRFPSFKGASKKI
jgi:hypothetical protein